MAWVVQVGFDTAPFTTPTVWVTPGGQRVEMSMVAGGACQQVLMEHAIPGAYPVDTWPVFPDPTWYHRPQYRLCTVGLPPTPFPPAPDTFMQPRRVLA